jgi:hypothetical protein
MKNFFFIIKKVKWRKVPKAQRLPALRMAELSMAPDSSLQTCSAKEQPKGVLSTNVGVGSNPTPDKKI